MDSFDSVLKSVLGLVVLIFLMGFLFSFLFKVGTIILLVLAIMYVYKKVVNWNGIIRFF